MKIDGKTSLCGVIAEPVEHSLSPAMHNANFSALGLNFAYVAMRVKPERLEEAVKGLRALAFRGFNVSVPHKQTIIPHLNGLDAFAQNCGAVNTVVNDNGALTGFNTDGPGAVLAAKEAKADFSDVVVVGAGGAGHAVAYAFAAQGSRVTILNRTQDKASELAKEIQTHGHTAKAVAWSEMEKALKAATFLAQTTRVGMGSEESAVPERMLHPGLTVLDAVYAPLQTRLIREARQKGAKTITGERMLLHQAVLANEKWSGRKADVSAMEKALQEGLKRRDA